MKMMENENILKQAISLLEGLDLTNAESVQINNTKYDDGSSLVEVGVSYPAVKTESTAELDLKNIKVLGDGYVALGDKIGTLGVLLPGERVKPFGGEVIVPGTISDGVDFGGPIGTPIPHGIGGLHESLGKAFSGSPMMEVKADLVGKGGIMKNRKG